jgi:hypothetical protein
MQRFLINPITDYAGREYWVVNFPGERSPRSIKPAKRVQKKFNSLERAEVFLEQIRREWLRRGKVELGLDPALHYDVMRAARILSDRPYATLEKAALIFRQCMSGLELRGTRYAVSKERRIELGPRFFLMVDNEAKLRNVSINEAAEGLLSEVALCRADQAIRQRIHSEEVEYEELKKRNDIDRQKLREMAKEAEIWKEFSNAEMMFELGRNSILSRKAEYQRRWRERRKALEFANRTNGNGSENRDRDRDVQ